jgi:hypothetical protein
MFRFLLALFYYFNFLKDGGGLSPDGLTSPEAPEENGGS